MDLSKRCIQEFDRRDWQRGEEYFHRGAVRIVNQQNHALFAKVQGSSARPYWVALDWTDVKRNTLYAFCSCPRFDDLGLCKHIAAVILAADAAGIGDGIPGNRNLSLEPSGDEETLEQIHADADNFGDESDSYNEEAIPIYEFGPSPRVARGVKRGGSRSKSRPIPVWRTRLKQLTRAQSMLHAYSSPEIGRPWSKPRQFWYVLDIGRTLDRGWPCVSLWQRTVKKNGTLGALRTASATYHEVIGLSSAEDQELIGLLVGNERTSDYGYSYGFSPYDKLKTFAIAPALFEIILPRLCRSQRFGWIPEDSPNNDEVKLLSWDEGPAWQLKIGVTKTADKKQWQVAGELARGDERVDLSQPLVLMAEGLVVFPDRIARLDSGGAFEWVPMLRQSGPLLVPTKQEADFLEWLAEQPDLPPLELPNELKWEEERPTPQPRLTISKAKHRWETDLECRLTFQYGDHSAAYGSGPAAWVDKQKRRAVRRDLAAEHAARERLLSAGASRPKYGYTAAELHHLASAKMPRLVTQLAAAGWQVEAEGRLIRSAGEFSFSVTSGVDWFDLEGTCDFGGASAGLPQLLAALRRGDKLIQLDDGSQGMLPEDWLARYGGLAEMGRTEGDRVRFLPTQAALLDALLAAQEAQHVRVDRNFQQWREKLKSFAGIEPRQEPQTFQGELRHYQREGLGWLHFLDDFGFGGCLADDMGLGKTVQVLALLDDRRRRGKANRQPNPPTPPSLAVVPRSLVFNWIEEARRFTPDLRVLNYTGLDRRAVVDRLHDYDLVLTTYGTLRRDVAQLSNVEFDYAILDEAQAIKNASSQAAKACRLLRARRRLAMSGTPIENHLGELWSIFEFLNPGMLGQNAKLHRFVSGGRENGSKGNGKTRPGALPEAELAVLSQALRPFMLRRTKQQVLAELPAKSEQTLFCELDAAERTCYDELREHYRQSLLARIQKVGVNRAKIHVLEALLRLRQAACHRGLLDAKKTSEVSSKLETLLDQLAEVIAEGHKALVFSQFTSFLAIVRRHLDQRKIVYEYLDGKTLKRQDKVERFQTDPACPLFLISLKAGGQGLNLTAADYVFILDPWWNPAVEAQAVDRAHRIGQQRPVFAYRLIARDTVEEKILELQKQKRDLAEAIVSADSSPLTNLTAEDLQLLLS